MPRRRVLDFLGSGVGRKHFMEQVLSGGRLEGTVTWIRKLFTRVRRCDVLAHISAN